MSKESVLQQNTIYVDEATLPPVPIGRQAAGILLHAALALGSWGAMMLAITLAHPGYVPPAITLTLSALVPWLAGVFINRWRHSEMATATWLLGAFLFLLSAIWILDMPTSPGQCFRCDAGQKLWLTFFAFNKDSGLLDGDGRFLATWPATALIAYAVGSRLALRRNDKIA